jgi:hypothetical protein
MWGDRRGTEHRGHPLNFTVADFIEILSHVECAHPLRVPGPRGQLILVRCGSRDANYCAHCSKIVVGDWAAIIRSGVFDPPGDKAFGWYFLTLTAPSFGPVHRVPRRGNTRRCSCGKLHSPVDSDLRGAAIDPETYDYDGQVRWNRDCGVLWDRSRRRLQRVLGLGVSYAVVREWQARGAIHRHCLIRVPGSNNIAPHLVLDAARSANALVGGRGISWGDQGDCRSMPPDPVDSARHIGYLSKMIGYSVKSVGSSATAPSSEHARWLDAAAHGMSCKQGCQGRESRCLAMAHRQYGARASVVSVSRNWSFTGLTRTKQAEVRREFIASLPVAVRNAGRLQRAQRLERICSSKERLARRPCVDRDTGEYWYIPKIDVSSVEL